MEIKYMHATVRTLILLMTSSLFITGYGAANAAPAPDMAMTLPPPPPPELKSEFEKKMREAPTAATEKTNISVQKSLDAALVPMTPDQIKHTKRLAIETEKLLQGRAEPRSPRDRDLFWSIGTGAHTLRLSPGYTTTILFFGPSGQRIEVAAPGAISGDKDAIEPNATGNAVVLTVKNPWRSTNLTVFLKDIPVPVTFTLTSEREADKAEVDYQVRVRVMDGAGASLERKDMQNMDSLLQLTNGLPSGNLATLPVLSVEKGDPSKPLNWIAIPNNVAQFRVGPEGLTYAIMRPGFRMIYPSVLAGLAGADGTQGYIIGGNNPRVFTVQDKNGAMYRITLQR
jgi:hypothetical protein